MSLQNIYAIFAKPTSKLCLKLAVFYVSSGLALRNC